MNYLGKGPFAFLASLLVFLPTNTHAGDTSIANIPVVGIVPAFFSVTSQGQPGELDLTPNSTVSNRLIGLLHFKFNENIQTLTVSSSTTSGAPEDSNNIPYQFGAGGFKVAFRNGCQTVDPAYNIPFTLTNSGVDVKSVLASALISTGIEEDCQITASYTGTNVALPLAGRFAMNIVVTMVAP